MPLFMDVHKLPEGVTLEDVQAAHAKDVEIQNHYGVCYRGFWYNEHAHTVTCFAEGPNREACVEVHRKAHGLVPDKIVEIPGGSVDAFLGGGTVSPGGDQIHADGQPDTGIRTLLVTEMDNLTATANTLGDAAALQLVECHDGIVRAAAAKFGGREVRHLGDGVMLSFASASAAVQCALEILTQCTAKADELPETPALRIGLAAGEPLLQHSALFGVAVNQARAICRAAQPGEILVSAAVRDLCAGKPLKFAPVIEIPSTGSDQTVAVAAVLGDPKVCPVPRPRTAATPTTMEGGSQRVATALKDRYRVETELGRGGMATVYLAHDLRHERRVAIKTLRADLAALLGPERFLQEIKVAAKLTHPNIVPLYDSGEANGVLYYVMPQLEGETLRQVITLERQLPVNQAVEIAREVATALDYAHRRGVVHRDIKPDNIFLHEGQAMVLDFGIALALTEAGTSRLTGTGLSLGTPTYMSPEQAAGDRNVDARTDIYALGCVLYEMLAGDPPFSGTNLQSLIARIVSEAPGSLASLRADIPASVVEATHRAMAKQPADRFASAGEFAAALGRN